MSKNEISNFIKCLDSYKGKEKMNFDDIINLLSIANKDFYEKKYYDSSFVGDTAIIAKKRMRKGTINPYYSLYNASQFFDFKDKGDNVLVNVFPEMEYAVKPIIPTEPKIKVEIQASISCIDDLLEIIDKYEYKENEEYNIDLKSLANIKSELVELKNMIGMENLKSSILNQLLYFIQDLHIGKSICQNDKEKKVVSEFKHTVICGPPGTGKTEIAKIIGRMYSKIGILKKNVFKKVTRNDLVAGYLGQTAIKTKAVISECLGGVLFIDEAYSLANGRDDLDSYSKECIDTLCESLSDHKDDLMVIIAGYDEELNETFFRANRGLESRFIWRFKIDEYSPKELYRIFIKKVDETDWKFFDDSVIQEKWFEKNKINFKNYGRDMELLFTYTKISHSKRIYGKSVELRKKITIEDLNTGYEMLMNNRKIEKVNNSLYGLYV